MEQTQQTVARLNRQYISFLLHHKVNEFKQHKLVNGTEVLLGMADITAVFHKAPNQNIG